MTFRLFSNISQIMWPVLLDMTKEECIQNLRHLGNMKIETTVYCYNAFTFFPELEAYSQLVSALRAQGPLSVDKRKLLKDTGQLLNITPERHKVEIRRAINDEKLNTIAYQYVKVKYFLKHNIKKCKILVSLVMLKHQKTGQRRGGD